MFVEIQNIQGFVHLQRELTFATITLVLVEQN